MELLTKVYSRLDELGKQIARLNESNEQLRQRMVDLERGSVTS